MYESGLLNIKSFGNFPFTNNLVIYKAKKKNRPKDRGNQSNGEEWSHFLNGFELLLPVYSFCVKVKQLICTRSLNEPSSYQAER